MSIPGLRSPHDKVSGLVYFGRMLDKIRLHAAGKLPEGWQVQLGSAAKAITPPNDAALASAEPVTPAKAVAAEKAMVADACANQHWPFFSAECLRGSTQTIKPRLVSMNMEDSAAVERPKPVATDRLRHVVRSAGSGHDGAASIRSRKPAKLRVAHTSERRPPGLTYAASAAAPAAMPGW